MCGQAAWVANQHARAFLLLTETTMVTLLRPSLPQRRNLRYQEIPMAQTSRGNFGMEVSIGKSVRKACVSILVGRIESDLKI